MLRAAALAFGLVVAAPAAAQAERFDHEGSLFAVAAPGAALFVGNPSSLGNSYRWAAFLGGGRATPIERLEVLLLARLTGRSGVLEGTAMGGIRSTFLGGERWGTFADLQLAMPISPVLGLGPRFGVGAQFEIAPVAGLFCEAAALFAFGGYVVFSGDVSCGLQLRTYVFER